MRIAILGAGIQGITVALALASEGFNVIVFDRGSSFFGGASGAGEGKIHLGFVYANDESHRTSNLMLEGAMHFAPLLDRWTGQTLDWFRFFSTPFQYLVAPDSLLSAVALIEHYARLDQTYRETYLGTGLHYLGTRPARLYQSAQVSANARSGKFTHCIPTQERAIATKAFFDSLAGLVSSAEQIETRFRREIHEVVRRAEGFCLKGEYTSGEGTWNEAFDVVINCLWDGRLALDAQMGLEPQRPWVFRRKFGIRATFENHRPLPVSATIVLGRFGDIACYPQHRTVYLSHYPSCLRGWSQNLKVPASWCEQNGQLTSEHELEQIVRSTVRALSEYVPEVLGARPTEVRSGVIFSWGTSDIDDPHSELHRRDEIGVSHADGYFTINTGKLTMAPLFAKRVADLVTGRSPCCDHNFGSYRS